MSGHILDESLRAVRQCSYRRPTSARADSLLADCALLQRLAGPELAIDTRVSIDICVACRRAGSSARRINPVLASQLHEVASRAQESVQGGDRRLAEVGLLREYALRNLECRRPSDRFHAANALGRATASLPEAVSCADLAQRPRSWSRLFTRWPRLGLIGLNAATGLGYQNQGVVANLPIDRWLAVSGVGQQLLHECRLSRRMIHLTESPSDSVLRRSLAGLDWLLFVESPLAGGITRVAKQMGVKVACVCNWEWSCPVTLDWLHDVDLMICPTQHSHAVMSERKRRFDFRWRMLTLPWPIDHRRFRFRLRRTCQRFVFVNGTGGCRARRLDQSPTPYRRKGIEVLFQAARLVPSIPITVYSQTRDLPPLPANVELRLPPSDNRNLFNHGDVCVQPSHWEGLGMPLLECQAAGMPLLTTDSGPMNEHQPMGLIPVDETEIVFLQGVCPVTSQLIRPDAIAEQLDRWYQRDIAEASILARKFIQRNHSWSRREEFCDRP